MQPSRPAPPSRPVSLLSLLGEAHEELASPVLAADMRRPALAAMGGQSLARFHAEDLAALDAVGAPVEPEKGMVRDWFGLRTPAALAPELGDHIGTTLPRPFPTDPRAPAAEWVGLALSIVGARGTWRVLEVAAGRGDLLLAGAVAARRRGLDLALHATEAEPSQFRALRAHAQANGIDPTAHRFEQVELGTAPDSKPRHGPILQDWLLEAPTWDWLRVAPDGILLPLLRTSGRLLAERVRVLSLATRSRMDEATAIRALARAGWRLIAEVPAILDPSRPRIAERPGVQVWRGPLA
jgi:hypothetical protein